jgi:hypothetical protein
MYERVGPRAFEGPRRRLLVAHSNPNGSRSSSRVRGRPRDRLPPGRCTTAAPAPEGSEAGPFTLAPAAPVHGHPCSVRCACCHPLHRPPVARLPRVASARACPGGSSIARLASRDGPGRSSRQLPRLPVSRLPRLRRASRGGSTGGPSFLATSQCVVPHTAGHKAWNTRTSRKPGRPQDAHSSGCLVPGSHRFSTGFSTAVNTGGRAQTGGRQAARGRGCAHDRAEASRRLPPLRRPS